jgi:FAD/FMN-containing dehydrogenase
MTSSAGDPALPSRLAERLGPRGLLMDASEVAPYESSARHGGGRAKGVVRPATADELSWAVREVVAAGERFVTQGAATGLVGAGTPGTDGTQLVLSTQRLREVLRIDMPNRSATVSVGYRLSDLNRAAAEHGLTFPIDLGADPTLGGMVATNTGGARLIRYGGVRENLLSVRAVLAQPAGIQVGSKRAVRKNNTGLDWVQLLCGSFGTLGVVSEATVRLHPIPRQSATALVAVESIDQGVALACSLEEELGEFVSAFEGISNGALEAVTRHQGRSILASTPPYAVLVEVSSAIPVGRSLDLDSLLMAWLERQLEKGAVLDAVVDKPDQLWRLRHAISESVQRLGRMVAFDIAVPRSSLGAFRSRALTIIQEVIPGALPCDFGHLGDGGVHLNLLVPSETEQGRIDRLRQAVYDAAVQEFDGSFSAEHGVGPYNQAFYDRYADPELWHVCGHLQESLDPAHQLGDVVLGRTDVPFELSQRFTPKS